MIVYTPDLFIEGFSISHVSILNPQQLGTTADEIDLYGVRQASIQANIETEEEYSNSVAIGSWSSVGTLDVSVESGYISLELMSRMMGIVHPPTAGMAPETVKQILPLYPKGSQRLGFVSMLFRMPARDAYGNRMDMDFLLYRVKVSTMEFGGFSYKDGLSVSYTAKAFLSDRDETLAILDRPAFGRLLIAGANDPMANTYMPPDNTRYDAPRELYGP